MANTSATGMSCTYGLTPGAGALPMARKNWYALSDIIILEVILDHHGLRGIRRLGGKDPAITLPELLQCAKHYSLPNSIHGVKVKVEIMPRVKGPRRHLAGLEKMA